MNLFSFTGRITRSTYWTVMIALTLLVGIFFSSFPFAIMYVGLAPLAVFQMMVRQEGDFGQALTIPGVLVLGLPLLIIFFFNLATTAKRFHDRGKSGWWALILFIPFVGQLWAYIECGFLPGTVGANAYGEDPQKPVAEKQIPVPPPQVTPAPPVAPAVVIPAHVEAKPPVMNGMVEQSVISNDSQKPEDKKSQVTEPLLQEVKANPSNIQDAKPGIPGATVVQHGEAPTVPPTSGVELKDVKVPTGPTTEEGQTMLAHKSMEQMLAELAEINKKAEEAKKLHPKVEPPKVSPVPTAATATTSAPKEAVKEKVVATPVTEKPAPEKLAVETPAPKEDVPGTVVMEDASAPKTKDDLSNALNNILAASDLDDEPEVKAPEKTAGTSSL